MTLEQTEAECAAVATAPRVSLKSIEDNISTTYRFTADKAIDGLFGCNDKRLCILSVCIVVMKNGFTVIGKSAPASASNFNEELGEKLAYEDAIRQIWPLEGYALRERLASEESE